MKGLGWASPASDLTSSSTFKLGNRLKMSCIGIRSHSSSLIPTEEPKHEDTWWLHVWIIKHSHKHIPRILEIHSKTDMRTQLPSQQDGRPCQIFGLLLALYWSRPCPHLNLVQDLVLHCTSPGLFLTWIWYRISCFRGSFPETTASR